MDIELIEIRDFLMQHHPFDLLPDEVIDTLPNTIEVRYCRRGTVMLEPEKENKFLWVVRTGAVETRDPEDNLLARLSEGECFGVRALMRGGVAANRCEAMEDSLCYLLPSTEFDRLCQNHPQFSFFFAPMGGDRLRNAREHADSGGEEGMGLMSARVSDMLKREPITISPNVTIQHAAQTMSKEGVSCLLITENGMLCGIVTDKDLRNRVVAKGLSFETPLHAIMTEQPHSIDSDDYLFDALLIMSQKNVRHLPVLKETTVAGVITTTNIIQKQTTSMVYLIGDIYKRTSVSGLKEVVKQVPQMVLNLVDTGATAHNIGHVVSTVTDAIATRLLQIGEEKFGAPPIPYTWIIMGSEARHEQTALTDQDNGMILDDSYDEALHGDYFRKLADFVCDALDECGYIHCPGGIMAKTDKWRQPLKVWKRQFAKWIDQPDPEAMLFSSIFFDMRSLHGQSAFYDELRAFILDKCKGNSIFLSFMARNALSHQPPLGFFKNFVLIRGGDHNDTFDLKHNGVVPIIDLARTYTLDMGLPEVNTQERLKAAAANKALSEDGANDLLDALEFISITRLRHQASQIRNGMKADNFMAPDDMSHFERNHLKDAFNVVKSLQSSLSQRYVR